MGVKVEGREEVAIPRERQLDPSVRSGKDTSDPLLPLQLVPPVIVGGSGDDELESYRVSAWIQVWLEEGTDDLPAADGLGGGEETDAEASEGG